METRKQVESKLAQLSPGELCAKGETNSRVHDLGIMYAGVLVVRQSGVLLVTLQIQFSICSSRPTE